MTARKEKIKSVKIKYKIAFIGPLPPPLGGVAVMNESIQNLLNDAYKIEYFNTSKGNEKEDLYNNNYVKKSVSQIGNIFNFISFAKKGSYKISNVFVTTGIGFIREALFIIILKFFNKKVIVHLHSKKYGEFFLSEKMIKILAYFLNKADKIIVLSEDHYNYFKRYFKEDKMVTIENFVDYSNYKCNIQDKVKEFLYVGRLSEKKGFFDLLESVNLLQQYGIIITIHVIGLPDNDETENRIHQYIQKKSISKYLQFHGAIFGEKKYELFKKYQYFLFPSQFENSPVVLKEAIAAKMAIVVSDIDANNIVLKPLVEYASFETGNAQDLAVVIKKVYLDNTKGLSMMQSSSEVQKYDKKLAKKKLINLINDLNTKSMI